MFFSRDLLIVIGGTRAMEKMIIFAILLAGSVMVFTQGDAMNQPKWNKVDLNVPRLYKDNLITTFEKLGKDFIVSLEFKPRRIIKKWRNILHMTIGRNKGRYGDRIPAIWLHSGKIHVRSAVNGNANYKFVSSAFEKDQWISIKVQQMKESDRRYNYSVFINGELAQSVINRKPQVFHNVKVYAASPWTGYNFAGYIRNFTVSDIDECQLATCQLNPCHEKANCKSAVGAGHKCTCMDGYFGDGTNTCHKITCPATDISSYECEMDRYQTGRKLDKIIGISKEECVKKCCDHWLCVGFEYNPGLSGCKISRYTRDEFRTPVSTMGTMRCQLKAPKN